MVNSSQTISSQIESTVTSILERVIFLEVSVHNPSAEPEMQGAIMASLDVFEPFRDKFELAIERDLAFDIATVLFNVQRHEITEDLAKDFTLEILNMIAGAVMGSVVDPVNGFRLGIPEIQKKNPENIYKFDYCFIIEGRNMFLKTPRLHSLSGHT